jgi:hypothetical protein
MHFKQVFKAIEIMGYDRAENLVQLVLKDACGLIGIECPEET